MTHSECDVTQSVCANIFFPFAQGECVLIVQECPGTVRALATLGSDRLAVAGGNVVWLVDVATGEPCHTTDGM